MRIRRFFLILTILIIMFLLTSCREMVELEDIGIVIATALDWEDGEVILTVEVIIPINRVEDSGDSSSMILQERGKSVKEAVRNVTLNFDRRLFFSHNVVVIFGEEFAKIGIGSYLDFFTKDNEPRETSYLAVAKGSKAYELMGINSSLAGSTGEYIKSLLDNTIYTLKGRGLTINEFFRYYYDSETPLLSVVEKKPIIDIDPMTGEIGSKHMLDVRGGAPFYKDSLVGYYSPEEMIGFNFLIDEVSEGIIVFSAPEELQDYSQAFTELGYTTTFEIVSNKTKNTIEIKDGNLHLDIQVRANGFIVEDNRGLNITELNVRDGVEKAIGEQIKTYIDGTLQKAQELEVESFGINHLFYSTYPKQWHEIKDSWQFEFSRMDYSITVDARIIRTGLTNTPTDIIKGEDF